MRKFGMNDEAFTGLEAAIVLIAFVVVAAVFSYVMLGAGFFTSQKSQEVVHTSVAQASSSMDVAGVVTGIGSSTTSGTLGEVQFYLKPTAGGSSTDMSTVAFAVTTKDSMVIISHDELTDASSDPATTGSYGIISWAKTIDGTADNLLEPGEIVEVTLNLGTAGISVEANDAFTIDVKPSVGAALPIVKHAPAGIEDNSYYELN